MGGCLVMSGKELERKKVYERVEEGELTIAEASRRLGISYRQCWRGYQRYKEEGAAGLMHRSRGRRSNRGKGEVFKQEVVRRYREGYEGFGPTLAAEKLKEEGYEVDHETLRRWLIAEGQWQRCRKRSEHRQWRERRGHLGELVQIDGSHHQWFGADKPTSCLMVMVDDATGRCLAVMAEQETTEAAMQGLWQWIERYGIPQGLYADRKNVYVSTMEASLEQQLSGEEPRTAFGQACAKLGIEIIAANSPQAKGRVERKHQVFQDRFVKELKLRGITTIEGANEVLRNGFVTELNRKFARPAREAADFHLKAPGKRELREIFCWERERTVCNDWTVRDQNQYYQIVKQNNPLPRPKERVLVRTLLDGTVKLIYRNTELRYKLLAERPARPLQPPAQHGSITRPVPAANHPWRSGFPLAAKPAR